MDDKILQQILDELKELNKNLSTKEIMSMKNHNPNFAESLVGSIGSIDKSLSMISEQLGTLVKHFAGK